jgi:hypothetical protein
MGVIYSVLCKQCRVYQDLDKFYALHTPVRDRSEALAFSERVEKEPGTAFRSALLVAFMGEHMGHDCTVVSDADEHDATDGYELHLSKVWDVHGEGSAG